MLSLSYPKCKSIAGAFHRSKIWAFWRSNGFLDYNCRILKGWVVFKRGAGNTRDRSRYPAYSMLSAHSGSDLDTSSTCAFEQGYCHVIIDTAFNYAIEQEYFIGNERKDLILFGRKEPKKLVTWGSFWKLVWIPPLCRRLDFLTTKKGAWKRENIKFNVTLKEKK